MTVVAQLNQLVRQIKDGTLLFPAQRQISSRHNLDKVHVIVRLLIRLLLSIIERIEMVIGPRHTLLANSGDNVVWQLRAKSQMVHFVRKGVLDVVGTSPVILEIMNVHITVAEGLSGGEVKISHDLVDADAAFYATAFSALFVKVLRVVLARTLFHVFSSAKGPRNASVGITDFGTSVAAASLLGVSRSWGSIAFSAVIGIKMRGRIVAVTM